MPDEQKVAVVVSDGGQRDVMPAKKRAPLTSTEYVDEVGKSVIDLVWTKKPVRNHADNDVALQQGESMDGYRPTRAEVAWAMGEKYGVKILENEIDIHYAPRSMRHKLNDKGQLVPVPSGL